MLRVVCGARLASRSLISLRASSSASGGPKGDVPIYTPAHKKATEEALKTHKSKDPDMLETIDLEDLPRAQKRFAKQFEKVNEERIKEIFKKNYKNHIAFTVLILSAVGIYFYTIYAVKQETFLEEIDEEMAREHPQTHGHLQKKEGEKEASK